MKARNKSDLNLIWEAYATEGTQGSTDDLTKREQEALKKYAEDQRKAKGLKSQGKQMEDDLKEEEEETKNEASHDNRSEEELDEEEKDLDSQDQKYFRVPKGHKKNKIKNAQTEVKEEGTGSKDHEWDSKHRKGDRAKFEKDPGYQQLRKKMQAEYDAKKKEKDDEKPKEEGLTADAIDRIDTESPELSQETWMLMKGDPRTNTIKVVKKYTGLDSEGAVQQLAMMLADLAAEQGGLPRDEHFPYEDKEQRGREYFENEIPEGTILKRIIEIDEDFDLLCVAPDDDYMMDELGR
jgi:hypothetical protein